MIPLPRIGEQRAPMKPKHGETCNGCGYCCAAELCDIGMAMFGKDHEAPCPAMRFVDGRFLCGMALMAGEKSMTGIYIKLKLGFGMGCDAYGPGERSPEDGEDYIVESVRATS